MELQLAELQQIVPSGNTFEENEIGYNIEVKIADTYIMSQQYFRKEEIKTIFELTDEEFNDLVKN